MRRNTSFLAVILAAFIISFGLSGCGKKAPEEPQAPAVSSSDEGMGPAESLDSKESDILEGRTSGPMLPVYFEFDKSGLQGEQVQRIENNAEFLKDNGTVTIRIEGNCDSRGTNEYNLALGERRAQSAKKYLMNLGITADRMSTVSWGEEKLLLFGQDEISWAQNRRADFVIVK